MRIQFVLGTNVENTIDIDVVAAPTKEQAEAIEDDIYKVMDEWEEEKGDFAEFDYYECIHEAVEKHIQIAENPIVKTIYL